MKIQQIHDLVKIEKECTEKIASLLGQTISSHISSLSVPDKTEEELSQDGIKILTYLYSIYHSDILVNNKSFQNEEEIYLAIKTHGNTSLKYQIERECAKLHKIGLLEKRKSGNRDHYYISKYGILYILSSQEEYEWDEDLLKKTIVASIHVLLKNHIDHIVFNEI